MNSYLPFHKRNYLSVIVASKVCLSNLSTNILKVLIEWNTFFSAFLSKCKIILGPKLCLLFSVKLNLLTIFYVVVIV